MMTPDQSGSATNTDSGSAGGTTDSTTTTTDGSASGNGSGGSNDGVSYDTHRRLLNEKKKEQEENRRLKAQLQERIDADAAAEKAALEKQGEYKKLLELERKKNEEISSKLTSFEKSQIEAKKLDAVLQSVDGNIPRKFWGLISTSSVVIDPETGMVDQMSVTKTVEDLRKDYPEIIKKGNGKSGLPADAPKGTQGTLTYDEWLKLPHAEMQSRLKEVRDNEAASNN